VAIARYEQKSTVRSEDENNPYSKLIVSSPAQSVIPEMSSPVHLNAKKEGRKAPSFYLNSK